MTARIRQIGDPILRQVSSVIKPEDITSKDIQTLISHMKNVLDGIKSISKDNGNALSAPQVGHLVRLILLRIDGVFCPMINPEFMPVSDQRFEFEEECFSLYDKRATVSRYYKIDVSYLDENNIARSKRLNGEDSGLVQHEVDHLNGVLFVDHVVQGKLKLVDAVLKDDPNRLEQIKAMMAYMTADR